MAEERQAQDVAREAIELCLKAGATDVVVMVAMPSAQAGSNVAPRDEMYFAGFSGRGLSVRGLLEMGMERIRDAVRTRGC